jgi:hypothetical protein
VNQSKTQAIVAKMMSNAAGLKYGSVSVTAKLHDGRVVQVTYSTNEHSRDTEPPPKDREE